MDRCCCPRKLPPALGQAVALGALQQLAGASHPQRQIAEVSSHPFSCIPPSEVIQFGVFLDLIVAPSPTPVPASPRGGLSAALSAAGTVSCQHCTAPCQCGEGRTRLEGRR